MRPSQKLLIYLAVVLLTCISSSLKAGDDINRNTYDALAEIHKLIGTGRYDEASTRLDAIRTSRTNAYEHALVLQTRGHLYARRNEHRQAIDALNACLALDALPKAARQDTRYLLIQMQVASASHQNAADRMDLWLASEKSPSAEAHALAGSIYSRVERLEAAADHLRRAIDKAKEPNELWFRQLVAVHIADEHQDAAVKLLSEMVRRFPERKEYWLQLSATYHAVGEEDNALAVMDLVYRRGLQLSESELLKLANFMIYMDLPFKAGGVLWEALRTGAISASAENWELVSDAWLKAREIPLALEAIDRALEVASSDDLQLRRARLAVDLEDWRVVLEATEAALTNGGAGQSGEAHMLSGIAHYHLDHYDDALEAFAQALSDDASNGQVRRWIDFVSASATVLSDMQTNPQQ